MTAFFGFFFELMSSLFLNIWDAIRSFFEIFNIFEYAAVVGRFSKDFNVLAWILAIISIMLLIAILVILLYLAYLGIRKYLRVRKAFLDKEKLVEQIDDLNHKVIKLIKEKESILALQVNKLAGIDATHEGGEEGAGDSTDTTKKATVSRFVKLMDVDNRYLTTPYVNTDPQNFTLSSICESFRDFACGQLRLFYEIRTIRLFFAAMATTKIIILEGISGTGKTSLPYALGKFVKYDSPIIAVQPSWRDKTELIGYLNEFTKRFNETDFLMSVYEANYRSSIGFVVLDEMNLARVEYYFAEILSLLEMPDPTEWKMDIVPDTWDTDPVKLFKGKLKFPTNTWFVGTANNDDSTFTITDKVYDRAVNLQLNSKAMPFEAKKAEATAIDREYLVGLFAKAKKANALNVQMMENFAKLDDFMIANFRMTFGNRIMKQIRDFLPVYVACGGEEIDGLDFLLCNKILRKLEGLNISFEQENLKKLVLTLEKLFGKNNMTESKDYVRRLLRR